MAKYRKKPVVVEAFQYDGDFRDGDGKYYVPEWAEKALKDGTMYYVFPRTSLDAAPELDYLYSYTVSLMNSHHIFFQKYAVNLTLL